MAETHERRGGEEKNFQKMIFRSHHSARAFRISFLALERASGAKGFFNQRK